MGGGGDSSGLWGKWWISLESLQQHFNDHGKNTGAISPQQYLNQASSFVNSKNPVMQSFTRLNGSTYMYNPVTNQFAVVSSSGRIVTYYYPRTGVRYWEVLYERYGIEE